MITTLLTMKEAADRLHTPVSTLRKWRAAGYGPQGAVMGRNVMYREADIETWINDQFTAAGTARKAV